MTLLEVYSYLQAPGRCVWMHLCFELNTDVSTVKQVNNGAYSCWCGGGMGAIKFTIITLLLVVSRIECS